MAEADVTAYLRRIADDELYRRNAFRVTGLATDAGPRAVRERQKKDAAAAAVGVVVGSDPRLPVPVPASADEVRAAYEVLADPRRRLVHEFFWLWGEEVGGCGCDVADHRVHDEAVAAHAAVLDREIAGEHAGWSAAREAWGALSATDAPRRHLTARLEALDDARLDLPLVEAVVREAPRALGATVVARAAADPAPRRLREEAERWPLDAEDLDDLLLAAVADRVARIEARLTEARGLLATDPVGAAGVVRPAVLVALADAEALAPHERFRHLADLRDRTAIVLNDAALRMIRRRYGGDVEAVFAVYRDAAALATAADTHDAIAHNEREARRRAAHPTGQEVVLATIYTGMDEAWRAGDLNTAVSHAGFLLVAVTDPDARADLEEIARHEPPPTDTPRPAIPTPEPRPAPAAPLRPPVRRSVARRVGVVALAFLAAAVALGAGTGSVVLAIIVLVAGALVATTVGLVMTS